MFHIKLKNNRAWCNYSNLSGQSKSDQAGSETNPVV